MKRKGKGILLKCPSTECSGHIWRYKGKMKVYAVCPDCRGNVKIEECRIPE